MAKKKKEEVKEVKMVVKPPRELREDEVRKEFRSYFVKIKRKLNLDPSLEEVLWLHLKSVQCAKPNLFDKGVKNFGYNI